jgi:hypothetical protein
MSFLNPQPLTPPEMMPVGEYSAGPFTVANINSANYNQNPSMLPSNKILIQKGAYAGTKSNCAAAKGKFVPYKSMKGGNKNISPNDNMNGGMKLNAAPTHEEANPRHNADPKTYKLLGGGKKRRKHTMKKRKSMRKHKKHAKRHHKRSRRMHKKHSRKHKKHHKKHTRKHKKHHKKHTRKHKKHHKKHSRKHKKHTRRHRRRSMKGGKVGGPQPFSNVPISFGYSANLSHLKPSMSAVANPVPFKAYEGCSKVSRS